MPDAALLHAETVASDERLVLLCFLAGRGLTIDAHALNAALRRSTLLLAAGGDPRRRLELHDRAVEALAEDLDTPRRRAELGAGVASLALETAELPATAAALERLRRAPDLAWRCYAMALLAEALADGD